jgi:Carboxypeptidase regulatory-like domain
MSFFAVTRMVGTRKYRKVSPFLLLCLSFVVLFCESLDAQMDTATITGYVLDAAAEPVAGVTIELIDLDHASKLKTTTNRSGLYIFPHVAPGRYRITVAATGFKPVQLRSLAVSTQDELQQNFELDPGEPSESITLAGNSTPIARSGAVGTLVDKILVAELPLNGRSFQTLFQLTPGVVITPTTFANQGQFSVNGQRTNTNYFVIDGVSGNFGIAAGLDPGQSSGGSLPALTSSGGTNGLVSTVDVQEFAILTSSYGAEFGRFPGAQISIVTRSGTQNMHGEVFDYLRNDAFDANDWFANRDGLKRAALRQNDFGGVLGGPFGKRGTTFFFATYEGLRLRQPTLKETDVPSMIAREAAPASIKPVLNAYPLPTGAEEGNGLAQATYGFSNPSNLDSGSIRFDRRQGEALELFIRYARSTSGQMDRGTSINSLSTVTDTRFSLQTLTVGSTFHASPTVVNAFRFNWSMSSTLSRDLLDSFGGAIPLSSKLVFPSAVDEKNGLFQVLPVLGSQTVRLSLGQNINNTEAQINLVNTTAVQIGNHSIKVGIDVRRVSPTVIPARYTQLSVLGARVDGSDKTSSVLIASSEEVSSLFRNLSLYAQDEWKAGPHFQITYGVRWEYDFVPKGRGKNGLQPFALKNSDPLASLTLADPGTPIYHVTANNFAPRGGFSYLVRNLLINGGAGLFYDSGNGPAGNAFNSTNSPFTAQTFLVGESFSLIPKISVPPLSVLPPYRTIIAFSSLLKLPYTWQWNLSVQRMLGNSQTLSIGYVGASGHSLLRAEQYAGGIADVPSTFGRIIFTTNAGYANFNSLQLTFRRRAAAGLDFVSSYTFAHSLDNVSTDSTLNSVASRFIRRDADYGPSDFDIRHTVTIGANYSPVSRLSSGLVKAVLSDWSVDPMLIARSSPPIDVLLIRQLGIDAFQFRPDVIAGVPTMIRDPGVAGGRRINPSALAVPAAGNLGDLGRNSFRGFPLTEVDLALQRRFHITEHVRLEIRAEAFNLFNHPNFGPPVSTLGMVGAAGIFVPQANFGLSEATLGHASHGDGLTSGFSPLYQIGGARSLQFALKMYFN